MNKMPMNKKIGIVLTQDRSGIIGFAKQLTQWLSERGCELSARGDDALALGLVPLAEDDVYSAADFLLCLGGDGTMLRAAKSARHGKPLLGINLGYLGYLTDADRLHALTSLENTLAGRYELERRMMLEVSGMSGETVDGGFLALNDVCVTRGAFSKLIELCLYINDEHIDTYRADGIIVCTPTGSTAYNLSAGGPILKPDVEMMAVTPICAHKIYSRAIVISAQDVVTLKIAGNYEDECMLTLDGRHMRSLSAGSEVTIRRSEHYTDIIKTNKMSFFDILRKKMIMPEA
jgi:NAD+ kinase